MSEYGTAPLPVSAESPAEAAHRLQSLLDSDEDMEKFASTVAPPDLSFEDVTSRMEDKVLIPLSPDEEEDLPTPRADTTWSSTPSIRDQIIKYPDSVRVVDPTTVMLSMTNAEDVKELNRIQRAANDPESPTLAILEKKRQAFEGSWTILLTFAKVEYMKL